MNTTRQRSVLTPLVDVWRIASRRRPSVRFVVLAQGRSGSSLLGELLSSHPDCDRVAEKVNRKSGRHPMLGLHLEALCRSSAKPSWGTKVKIRDLDFHSVDEKVFFPRLVRRGWRLIHLVRLDQLRQAVSMQVMRARGAFHKRDENKEALGIEIDLKDLLREMRKRAAWLRREHAVLNGLHHVQVAYERDLLDPTQHQPTADRLFEFLGLEPAPVTTTLQRITPRRLSDFVVNADQVLEAVGNSEFANEDWWASYDTTVSKAALQGDRDRLRAPEPSGVRP